MTILGYLLPEHTPWDSFWDMGQDWGPGRISNPSFDRWQEPEFNSRPFTGERRIPIQIERPDCFDYWEEWSDSDCDDQDMNTNSNYRPLRRKRFRPAPARNTSNKESVSDEVIDVESDREGTRRKIPLTETSSQYLEDQNLPRSHKYATRASKDPTERQSYIICDSDTENDINETCSYSVYKYLKGFLNSTGRQIDAIRGDGNCFFRALSKVLYGNQTYYDDIRQAVVDVIEQYPRKFEAFTDGTVPDHIKFMRQDKSWATQTEIYAAATLLNRDVYILSPDQTGETYRWLLFKPQFKYNSDSTCCKCYITICHTHGNHYDRIGSRSGKCNCDLPTPEMSGINESVDLTDENEIV